MESVLPHGSNLLRARSTAPRAVEAKGGTDAPGAETEVSDETAAAADGEAYDAEDAPWPTDAEGVFQDDAAAPVAAVVPAVVSPKAKGGETVAGALPGMDELRARLNPTELQLLEELFRARFVSTKRIPEGWLKT